MPKRPSYATYEAYGLCVLSDLPLPFERIDACTRAEGVPDLIVRREEAVAEPVGADGSPEAWTVDFAGEARVRVNENVMSVASLGAPEQAVAGRVATEAVGQFLQRRGDLVMQANVVSRGRKALVLLGPPKAGKTALSRELLLRGYRFISDDLCVARHRNGSWLVYAGPPSLHVRRGGSVKRREPAISVCREAEICSVIAVLPGAPVALRTCTVEQAIAELARYAHMPDFLEASGLIRTHIDLCTRLAGQVPVHTLNRGTGEGDMASALLRLETMVC